MFLLTTAAATATRADPGAITTTHLILIAVLIVLVIGAIIWGARLKSARVAAQHDGEERTEALLAHPQTQTAVSPAPPPLGDSGMTAGAALEPAVAEQPAATVSAEAATAPAPAARFRLVDVKGLGPKAVPLLEAQGIVDLRSLAGLSAERAAQIDASLGTLAGRMARDKWVEQAKLLAAGDVAAFEATYGKI